MEGNSPFFSLFSSSSENKNKSLKAGFGFRELTKEEQTFYCASTTRLLKAAPVLNDIFNFTELLSNPISLRIFTSGCYYLDSSGATWSPDGIEVLPDSTINLTHCVSSHLTEFASGMIILPASIDFGSAWANTAFEKNLTLYIAVILISCLYILMLIWCRYMDVQDNKKRCIYLLQDNDPLDFYFYELIFFTGNRKNAGTQSRVSVRVAGDFDDTGDRRLEPISNKNRPLQRGSIDSFILSTNK